MNVLHAFMFGYVFTAAITMGECALQAISSESTESPSDSFIGFKSAPDKVVDGSVVHVRYQCLRPCQLAVEVVVSTLRKKDLVVFSRKWISGSLGVYRIHLVQLRLPPSILYQKDFFNRNVLEVDDATVRARLVHLKNGSEPRTHHDSMISVSKVLEIVPLSQRPAKPPTESLSWFARLMWQMTRDRTCLCPHESDIVEVLNFPLASTGEYFGMVRRFQPFTEEALEQDRLHALTQPSVTLSVWIYLLKWCHESICGIVQHIDRRNSYESFLMMLTDTGDITIQARLTTGVEEAFQISAALPLRKWIRVDFSIQDSKVRLCVTCNDETQRHVYDFTDSIYYDDTDGYFVIGGSKYMPGIHGYFGPIKYYRFGTEKIKNQLHLKTLQELDKAHRKCQEIKAFTKAFLKEVTESHGLSTNSKAVCTPHFIRLWGQSGEKTCSQKWTRETPLKYSSLFQHLQTKDEQIRTGSLGMEDLRTTLFKEAVAAMFPADPMLIKITPEHMSLLQVSSCFGNHKASLLLASIHLSGLGHSVDQNQGHVYSLIGALGDDRFALMHAGYKHTQGLDGFPKDLDMAYSYYSNAGAQSNSDMANIHEDEQYTPEHIYLSNQEDINSLTDETSDHFQYLKFQAKRGDADSQRHLGRMLYWGEQRVSKDIVTAAKWLHRSSMQMKDPSAMYDYSILLMQGHGVKKNYTRAVQLLKKAAAMGSAEALNGLGWYHGVILSDHESAMKYYEKAALNGSADGMYNLGACLLSGPPHRPGKNETAAFHYFANASRLGHVAASVAAAWYLSTGSLGGVSQDAERAVIMLKKVCEVNGHLGFMIREALHAYLRDSRQEAFVKYVLAAETGLGLAQSNAAHLCEELDLDCQWRYHNFSILNYDSRPSALLKMGDYYYYSSGAREDSLSLVGQALSMYSRAALAGSPQGMYNLGILAQQGHVLPQSIHRKFNLSHHDEDDIVVEKMLRRCVEGEDGDAVTPCSLALLRVQMGKALRRMTQNGAQLLLTYASLLSVCVLLVFIPLQSCLGQRVTGRRPVELRARASPVSQEGVNLNREQDGVTGGPYRVAGNLWLTEQRLRQTSDLAVTLSGVCLCAFWTTFLYHLQ